MAAPRDAVERFGDRMARLAWVRPKQEEPLPVAIGRQRIYILPTGFGLFVTAVLATIVLGALNYNNNPGLVLAFLFAAVAHNSLVQAHLLLSGVRLRALHAEPAHAGGTLTLRWLFDAGGGRERAGLELLSSQDLAVFTLPAQGQVEVCLQHKVEQRGWHNAGRVRLSTVRPFGLARAWSWLRPDVRMLVYPALEADAPPLPESGGDGESPRTRAHGEQPHHLRDYRSGDALRQVAWKASARADRLLVREYEATSARELILDWNALAALPHEARIRRLARWVVEAERSGSRYGLRLPGESIDPGRGAEHRHACLRALALMPVSTSRDPTPPSAAAAARPTAPTERVHG